MNKLSAVNDVLRRLGKPPAAALDTTGRSTHKMVENAIDDAASEIMSRGWEWNQKRDVEVGVVGGEGTDANYIKVSELEPDGDDFFTIYHVDTSGSDRLQNVSRRGDYLYHVDKNTFAIGDTYKLVYTFERAWDDIPYSFQQWAVALAAFNYNRHFAAHGSGREVNTRDGQLQTEMRQAQSAAMNDEIRAVDANVLGTTEMRQIRGRPRTPDRSIY